MELYDSKVSLPNKLLQENGTVTDIAGNPVTNSTPEYDSKPSLPNKFLNPDGTYSTLNEIISSMIDTDLFIVVDELPASGDEQKIYLVPDGEGGFTEYHWTGDTWDPIGAIEIDLSDYSTTEEMNTAIRNALSDAKDYADGKANTAETNAKAYADSLARNYDAVGSANTAETNAKTYADTKKSEAITSANNYTNNAIQTSITQVLGGSY